ncbi:MAG: GNAT family N-acetyltransferase [Anaerolineae bacterium]|nr:GNAT family N-acetyltransferase [Anaerolineae bacterium]
MSTVTVRPTMQADVESIALLWHEKNILLQQMDSRFTPRSQAEHYLSQTVTAWLDDADAMLVTALRDNQVVGFVGGRIQSGLPGLLPEQMGTISVLAVEAHGEAGGVGRMLLEAARGWFIARGIRQISVQIPARFAVEQAFWRASGAKEWMDVLWLTL